MSDLDIVIKALRETANDLYRYNDSLKDVGADALETFARNLEEAVRQRQIEEHRQEPVVVGLGSCVCWTSVSDGDGNCRRCGQPAIPVL